MMYQLNYLWRVLGTGISFTVFGIGGLVLSLTVFPLLNLFIRDIDKRKQKARYIIHRSFAFFLKLMQSLGIFTFHLEQAKRDLAHVSGKIIIANHPSLIDVVALISIMPRADCVVKRGLWQNPFLKGVVTAANFIKNDEDIEPLINACDESLEEGYNLIIFPEGTRTTPNKPMKLQRGAANIALRCQRNFIPVLIDCDPTTLTKNEKWYQIPDKRVNFTLCVRPEIDIQPFIDPTLSPSLQARKLTAHLKEFFEEECKVNATT
ncbi:MAG: 1-acyl-sn-glycerol-3-phosphate acyltransferase [Kangiellaceae bacterium]|nr:1-acyl-sn-glycerol-3-phosphate acyltransferase [Kangiellaceae bacterium]